MIAIRQQYNTSNGIVDTYRWNGTNYVSVIPRTSIVRGINWDSCMFYVWINADGTRLIASSPVSNADVYDLAPSSKFSYTSATPAVAEIYGNIALLKSVGTSTITATQIAPAGNATTTSDLIVVNTTVISNFTLGAKALDESAIVLPQPTTTLPVTFAQTFSQVGQTILYNNSTLSSGHFNLSPVRISADGTKILIGGIHDSNRYGTLRMFSLDNNVWTQVGGDMIGNKGGGLMGVAVNGGVAPGGEIMAMSADATLVVACDSDYYTPKNLYFFKYDPNKTTAPAKWSVSKIIDTSYVTGYGSTPLYFALSADGKVFAVIKNGSILINKSTDGGVTWTQTGTINNSTGLPYNPRIFISANGSRIVSAEEASLNVNSAVFVHEWNNSTWTSTKLQNSDGNCYGISYDGNIVVVCSNSYLKRYYKNASGVWTGISVLATASSVINLNISGDGSTLILNRRQFNTNYYGIVDTYRWNGTDYVSVIPRTSIVRGQTWDIFNFYAWVNGDGTRLIASSPRYNANVYDLAPSSKFSYTSSNSAVAEIYGNLALLKSVGTSTITAAQSGENATIASDLTLVNTGIIPTGTLSLKTVFGQRGGDDSGFYLPVGIGIDASGNMVITDALNGRVKVHSKTNNQFLYNFGTNGSDNGQFKVESINPVEGVACFMNGNIIVADTSNHRVQVFNSAGTFISAFGSSGSNNGQFNFPRGVAIDRRNNNIIVSDTQNHRIQVFSETGTFIRTFGWYGASDGEFKMPSGVCIDLNGNIYVADTNNQRVQVFSETGTFIRKFGSSGSGNGEFTSPRGIAIDPAGKIAVIDYFPERLQVFNNDGTFRTAMNTGTYGGTTYTLNRPMGVAINTAGEIIVTNSNVNQIWIIG
jgi:hypothetical protein